MKIKRFVVWTVSIGIVLVSRVPSNAQSPPFSGKIALKGSTVYNALDDGSNDYGSDWYVDLSDPLTGSITMENEGLVFAPGEAQGDSVRHQLKRGFQMSDGEAVAAFRIEVSNVDEIGFYIGLYSLEPDPYFEESREGEGTEPTYSAYFSNPATGASKNKVSLRTRNDDSGNEETDEFTIESGTAYDIVIEVDGSGSTNEVIFWHREAGCSSPGWCSHTITASVPEDDADIYFSMVAFTEEEFGTTETLTVQLFEFEADAGG